MKSRIDSFSASLPFSLSVFGLALLLAVLVGTGAFALLKRTNVFAIRAIPLEWSERLNHGRMEAEIARDIEASVGIRLGNVMGRRPWEVDLQGLSDSIKSLAWIADARIQRVFPDRLVVAISPKRPLAVITASQGRASGDLMRPISYDGELMPDWQSAVVPDVPFLRGEQFVRDASLRAQAVALIKALPESGVLSRSNLAEIGWTNGFTLLLLSPRTEIQLGASEIATKLRRVAQVLNYLSARQKRAPVLDATSVKKVVVRAHHRP